MVLSRLPFVIVALAAVPAALAAIPAWSSLQVWSESHQDQLHRADAIVVLGAAQYNGVPSPVLKARLDHALHLYQSGLAPLVITTGGKQAGDTYTEADSGQRYLIEHGVPTSRLLGEDRGRTTFESLSNVADLAPGHAIRTVLLVSDPLHSARIKRMALDLGFQAAYASPAAYQDLNESRDTKLQQFTRETASLAIYQLGLDRG